MKFTNWLSRNRNPLSKSAYRRSILLLVFFTVGNIFLPPQCRAGIALKKISQLTPPFDGFSPQTPTALAISPADLIYLLDSRLAVVIELTPDGNVLQQFGGPGSGSDQFSDPADICALSGLDIFVADRGNDRVVRLDRKLNYLAQFRSLSGTQTDLTFENPQSVLLGPRGDLFIADGGNDRILKIDPAGRPVFSFGFYGESAGSLLGPRRIEPDPDEGLWILDRRGHVVHFDEYGGYLGEIIAGTAGIPTGLAVSKSLICVCSDSSLWIYDRSLRQINTFSLPEIGLPADVTLVDLAFRKERIWLLDSEGTIHRFQLDVVR